MVSLRQTAQRAFVKALLALAATLSYQVDVTRDSEPDALNTAYGQVIRKAARKRQGQAHEAAELRRTKALWDDALAGAKSVGRPPAGGGYRVCATAVLLTYQSFKDLTQWRRFVSFLEGRLAVWQVIRWCATLESCKTGRWHAHLMLQFRGVQDKSSKSFVFERIFPNASSNDYLNEGMGRRNPQQSIDRAFFYVFANKIGTVLDEANLPCVAGNYMPAWVTTVGIDTYRVQGRWPEALWKHYKLEDHMYEQYLYLARDGVQARKRNLDACKAWKEAAGEQEEIDRVVKRIRSNGSLYQPFPVLPEVAAWQSLFASDMLRYPLLILIGASASGKTEFAKSLFKQPLELKVGNTHIFPAKMVEFRRGFHDALILDDVRDLDFLVQHQEKLQGKYDSRIEFATTQGGTCFFTKYLFQTPTVVTINFTTRNLTFLEENDWLSRSQNRVVVRRPPPQA